MWSFSIHLEQLAGVIEATPGHVGDVQETVESIEVDEGTEIGNVLDRALANIAGDHFGQKGGTTGCAFGFNQFATAQNHVLTVGIQFDDLELVRVANVGHQVLGWRDVDLARRAERLDPDVDEQAAFDDAFDLADDRAAFVANGLDAVPVLLKFSFFLGEVNVALFVFGVFDEDIDKVAEFDVGKVLELGGGYDAFGLAADIHKDFLGSDFDNGTANDLAGLKRALILPQHLGE